MHNIWKWYFFTVKFNWNLYIFCKLFVLLLSIQYFLWNVAYCHYIFQKIFQLLAGAVKEHFRKISQEVQKQFRRRSGAVQEQFMSSSWAVQEQFRSSSGAVQEQFRSSSRLVKEWFRRSSGVVQEQFMSLSSSGTFQ